MAAHVSPRRMWQAVGSVARWQPFERDRVERRLRTVANVDDLRYAARRLLPGGVFDYIDGGAGDERTLARNVSAFQRWEFRPRVLRDVSAIDTSTSLLGRRLAMPLVLAPTGYTRLTHPGGERSVARAAARAGIAYALSTMSTYSIEDVAAVAPEATRWFQLYTWNDRALVASLIDRAEAAGYDTLVLTVDTAVLGNRERDRRRGFTMPPRIGPGTILDVLTRPRWTWNLLTHDPIVFANVIDWDFDDGHRAAATGTAPLAMAQHAFANFDRRLSWDTVGWLRDRWGGSLVLKGIQSVADAERAVDAGADAIALSNHGGRQLDDAPVPIELVAPVRAAVGDAVGIICDGGVRRGADIVKAVALGADAVSIGRPYLWGAAVGGERGVDWVLDHFRQGMHDTMALCGCTTVDELGSDLLTDISGGGIP